MPGLGVVIDQDSWDQHQRDQFDQIHADVQAKFGDLAQQQSDVDRANEMDFAQRAQAQFDAVAQPYQEAQRAASFTQQAQDAFDAITPSVPAAPATPPLPGGSGRADQGANPPGSATDWRAYAAQAAQRVGLDPGLFQRQIQQESNFDPNAVSPAGAKGIAQFMPETAHGFGIDPLDPKAALDTAANWMASLVQRYGGDVRKALAAYNAGPGNVDTYGGVPPFEETQRYVHAIADAPDAGSQTPATAAPVAPGQESTQFATARAPQRAEALGQFEQGLPYDQAQAICGPVAALAFAQANGRNPDLGEARRLAAQVGWTSEGGMNGVQNEQALLTKMGVASRLDTNPDFGRIAQDAANGNPVIISTPVHYYYANGYDPDTGRLRVMKTGTSRRGGGSWMSPQEIATLDGGINGALFVDNPQSPAPSVGVQLGQESPPSGGDATGDRPPSEFEPPSRFQGDRYLGAPVDQPLTMGDVGAPTVAQDLPRTPLGAIDLGANAVEARIRRSAADQQRAQDLALQDFRAQRGEAPPLTAAEQQDLQDLTSQAALSLSPEPIAQAGGAAAGPGLVGAVRRLFHGTPEAFDRPTPGRFDENGLAGPAYYATSAPEVASAVAGTGEGANVRAVTAPGDLNLFDLEQAAVPRPVVDAVSSLVRGLPGLPEQPTAMQLYTSLVSRAADVSDRPKAVANKVLAAAGFDGIAFDGERMTPGVAHDVVATFPEALPKLRNAISGGEGGSAGVGPAVSLGSTVAGGLAGYETAPPRQPDESDAAYRARVAAQTAAGAAGGLALATGAQQLAARRGGAPAAPVAAALQRAVDDRMVQAEMFDPTAFRREPTAPGAVAAPLGSGGVLPARARQGVLPGAADLPTSGRATNLVGDATTVGTPSPSLYDRFQTVRFAGMLSSTATQLLNNTANAANTLADVGLKPVQALIDAGVSKATGAERTRYLAEAAPQAKAFVAGMLTGAQKIPHIMATGVDPETAAALDVPRRGLQSGSAALDALVEAPLRALSAADAMWRGGAYAGHAAALATRQAIKEGLTGAERAQRVDQILSNLHEYPSIDAEASRLAARAVFQEHRPELDPAIQLLKGTQAKYVADVVLPFVRTPYNVAAQGVGMTPLGFAGALQAARAGQRGEAIDRAVRAAVGTAALGYGLSLASAGYITGATPDAAAERSTLPDGWKPYSLRIPVQDGAVYVPLQMLGPIAMPLGVAAALGDLSARAQAGADPQKLAYRGVSVLAKYVGDQAFLQGLTALPNIIDDPQRYMDSFLESTASSLMPASGLQKQVDQFLGRAPRDPKGALQGFLASSPVTSPLVAPRRGPLGDERQVVSGPMAFLAGTRVTAEHADPTLETLRRAGVGVPGDPTDIDGVPLTPDEQARFRAIAGARIRDAVARVDANPRVAQLAPDVRRDVYRSAVEGAREQARGLFVKEIGADAFRQRLRAAPAGRR